MSYAVDILSIAGDQEYGRRRKCIVSMSFGKARQSNMPIDMAIEAN